MSHDYGELLELAVAPADGARVRFDAACKAFAYDLLRDGGDPGEIVSFLLADLDALAAQPGADPGAVAQVRQTLLGQFEDRARKNAVRRRIFAAVPMVLVAIIIVAYFSWRFANFITIDQPIDSREGMKQRAAAVEKVIRYDNYHLEDVKRFRWFVQILAWPTEPSGSEVKGAQEFVTQIYSAGHGLSEQGPNGEVSCSLGAGDNALGLSLAAGTIAHRVRSPATKWRDPPIETLRDIVRGYACPNAEAFQKALHQKATQ